MAFDLEEYKHELLTAFRVGYQGLVFVHPVLLYKIKWDVVVASPHAECIVVEV